MNTEQFATALKVADKINGLRNTLDERVSDALDLVKVVDDYLMNLETQIREEATRRRSETVDRENASEPSSSPYDNVRNKGGARGQSQKPRPGSPRVESVVDRLVREFTERQAAKGADADWIAQQVDDALSRIFKKKD